MYEYESKKIKDYFELKDVCRKANSYFVGSFMLEMIMRRKEWENTDWYGLAAKISNVLSEYEEGGGKAHLGAKSHNSVRSALKCFERFLSEHN